MFHKPSSGLVIVTAIVGYLVISGINRLRNARHTVLSILVLLSDACNWRAKQAA
jgi:hypothetical protein